MGINPFNQPDVESAKIETRALTAAYEQTGKLPAAHRSLEMQDIKVYATEAYAAKLKAAAPPQTLVGFLGRIWTRSILATTLPRWPSCPCFPSTRLRSRACATRCATRKRVATCLGFGPRFLHSTGQDYKGGPNTGVFLQITADHAVDVAIPGQKYSFGIVIDAQAAGDLAVLESRGRRALRVHLGADLGVGLSLLAAAVDAALQ